MNDRYVAVLDAGTSSLRCFVFDARGRISSSRSEAWSYLATPDSSPYAREFDTERVWQTACGLLQGAIQDARATPRQVAAVTATSQRQGVVFLDRDGREIYAGPNIDLRAVFEGGAIDEQMGDRVYRTTGHTPSFLLAPAKLRWFQLQAPEAYARIASVLPLADWLVFRLSGTLVSEPSLAAEAGLLDITRRQWCTDILDDLGLVGNGHIPVVGAGEVAGGLREAISAETGIAAGTPVTLAGADTQCGLLGMGVWKERQAGIVAGWSAPLQMVTDQPRLAPARETWAGCHVTPKAWVLESGSGDAGDSYRWLADMLWGRGPGSFDDMDAEAASVPSGAEGTLAFLGPSRMDMGNVGLRQGGILFPVPMTVTQPDRGHLTRAAMEGIAYALRQNLQQAETIAGQAAKDIAVGGGMTRSSTWTEILVNVLGRPVRVSPTPQASALGAYLCTTTALGDYKDLDEAADSVVGSMPEVKPDPQESAQYRDHYQHWADVSEGLESWPV